MKKRTWLVGVIAALALVGPSCSKDDEGLGDETHFQCEAQKDCDEHAPGTECIAGYCERPDVDAGNDGSSGAGGAGGADCDDGTLTVEDPGPGGCLPVLGNAGALGYVDCAFYRSSLTKFTQCPTDGGAKVNGKQTVLDFCDRAVAGVPSTSYLGRFISGCPGSILVGENISNLSLDPEALCSPDLQSTLRECVDAQNPCALPPLCDGNGVWGCDQIREACPAITDKACHAGFDSRGYAARVDVMNCIKAATGDCSDAFYRCVWGL